MKIILAVLKLFAATTAFACGGYADLTVHEWGTFTSVQGGDGKPLVWQAQKVSDLPEFVYDWFKPGLDRQTPDALLFGKGGLSGLQRMETPVIYFYSPKERDVRINVGFPQGQITEWYPQASRVGPCAAKSSTSAIHSTDERQIEWGKVHILPPAIMSEEATRLPADSRKTHYLAARATEANLVRVNNLAATNAADEYEKFLFYRGTGSFPTPLTVRTSEARWVSLENTGDTPLRELMILHVQNGRATWARMEKLEAGQRQAWRQLAVKLGTDAAPLPQVRAEISTAMAEALVRDGLFPAEAQAMVNTWSDSWFAEEGVRVLYLLPRAWTDGILPLQITPAAGKLVRVMVGRAEIIPPTVEQDIAQAIKATNDGKPEGKERLLAYRQRLGRFYGAGLQLGNAALVREQNKPVATAALK